jgi:predicted GNAT superfamily acetyltransferase
MTPEIAIRRARTPAEYHACQEVQRRAWGIADDSYIVPIATMVGAQHHGGIVLGAFLPSGEAVGMSFAFLGRIDGQVGLYSQLTGVVPGFQDRGIGLRLKTAQREIARAERLPWIAWAFDPLQAGNARFNLEKLGATCGRLIADMYGPRTDALNRETPTDRLIAVWPTDPDHSRQPINPSSLESIPRMIALASTSDHNEALEPRFAGPLEESPFLLLEIPSDINALRASVPALARRWGAAVQNAFQAAFAAGYLAIGFVREESAQGQRSFYVLGKP